jgi:hypothetical protein
MTHTKEELNLFKEICDKKKELNKDKRAHTLYDKAFEIYKLDDMSSPMNSWNILCDLFKLKDSTRNNIFQKYTAVINQIDSKLAKKYLQYRRDFIEIQIQENKQNKDAPVINHNNEDEYIEFIKSLYIDIPPVRSDVGTIKLRNYDEEKDNYYKDGKFIYNTTSKVERKCISHLTKKQVEFIENLDTEWLFTTTSANRNNAFLEYLNEKTGKRLNRYRHEYVNKYVKELEQKQLSIKQIFNSLKELAQGMNNSVDMCINLYLDENYDL